MARRFPEMELATDALAWRGNAMFRSLVALPVRLGRDRGRADRLMLVVTANLRRSPARPRQLADCFRRLVQPTLDEPGCLMFVPHVDRDDPAGSSSTSSGSTRRRCSHHRETPHYREIVLGEIFHLIDDRDRRLLRPARLSVRFGTRLYGVDPDAILAKARAAEALGFDSLWRGDHLILPTAAATPYPHAVDGGLPFPTDAPVLDVLTVLGWVAQATSHDPPRDRHPRAADARAGAARARRC